MRKRVLILLISLFICLSIVLVGVMADSATGLVGIEGSTSSVASGVDYHTTYDVVNVTGIQFHDIENMKSPVLLTSYFPVNYYPQYTPPKPNVNIPVSLYAGDTIIGSGTFAITWDSVTSAYTMNLLFNTDWNPTGLTGITYINFTTIGNLKTYNTTAFRGVQSAFTLAANAAGFAGLAQDGVIEACLIPQESSIIYSQSRFYNTWLFTNVTMSTYLVNVTKSYESLLYASRVYVYAGTTTLASESSSNTNNYSTGLLVQRPTKIAILDGYSRFWNISIASIVQDFNISITPTSMSPGDSATGTIYSIVTDPTLVSVTGVSWKWSDEKGSYNFYESGNVSRPLDYKLKSGTWYGFDDSSTSKNYVLSKGTSIPNPVSLSGISSTGEKYITCLITTSDGNYYILAGLLTIGGEAEQSGRVLVRAIDWRTNDQVAGAAINIKNLGTDVWSNETTVTGRREFFSPIGSRLYIEAYKSGYDRANNPMYQVQGLMDAISITMFPTGSGSTTIANSTLYVTTYDYDTYELRSGLNVRILDDGQTQVTGNSGTVMFTVKNGSVYTVRAGCPANDCIAQVKTETVSGASYVIQFYIESYKVTAVPTLAPGQTATATAIPTQDLRTNTEKGTSMVKILYDNGETIVTLCVFVTILGLLGVKLGK